MHLIHISSINRTCYLESQISVFSILIVTVYIPILQMECQKFCMTTPVSCLLIKVILAAGLTYLGNY